MYTADSLTCSWTLRVAAANAAVRNRPGFDSRKAFGGYITRGAGRSGNEKPRRSNRGYRDTQISSGSRGVYFRYSRPGSLCNTSCQVAS
jgi:hypothetical protein